MDLMSIMKAERTPKGTPAAKTRKKKEVRIPTAIQINNMLTTYRKNDKEAFKDIMLLAEANGIALKSQEKYYKGALPDNPKWISESKRAKNKRKNFYLQLREKYGGSYSNWEKRRKAQYNRYLKNVNDMNTLGANIKPLSFDDYKDFRKNRDDLIDEIYAMAYNINANEEVDDIDYVDLNHDIRDISDLDDETLVLAKLQEKLDNMQSQLYLYDIDPEEKEEF